MSKLTVHFDDYPAIEFSEEAWERTWYLTRRVKSEVGWIGRVERLSAFRFRISEVFLPGQDVHGSTTEIQPNDMGDLMVELQESHGLEIANQLTAHFHSHADMGVFRSGQDMRLWERWRSANGDKGRPTIMGRTNKAGDFEAELYLPDMGLTIEGLVPQLEAKPEVRQPWQDELDRLIKERVREKVYTQGWRTTGKGKGQRQLPPYGGYGQDIYGDFGGYIGHDHSSDLYSHRERTQVAAKFGLMHYNKLHSQDERDAWRELTDRILDAQTEVRQFLLQGPEADGYVEEEAVKHMAENPHLLDAEGFHLLALHGIGEAGDEEVVS